MSIVTHNYQYTVLSAGHQPVDEAKPFNIESPFQSDDPISVAQDCADHYEYYAEECGFEVEYPLKISVSEAGEYLGLYEVYKHVTTQFRANKISEAFMG